VDGKRAQIPEKVYLMLNKPKGLVTSTADELGRKTVFDCLQETKVPHLLAVGRLDKDSEGLLLFTNDNNWAAKITSPETHLDKTYQVKINCIPNAFQIHQMQEGVTVETGEFLKFKQVQMIKQGTSNSWLEVVLDEGKNRQIHKVLETIRIHVVRLIRIRIGSLELRALKKGEYRYLTKEEVNALSTPN
jgi:23S rRNA pseudouridine2605 synthase